MKYFIELIGYYVKNNIFFIKKAKFIPKLKIKF